MSPHNRHVICPGGGSHAVPNGYRFRKIWCPEHVDDGDWPAAHCGYVAEINHYGAIAGEPWIVRYERLQHPFRGKEKKAVCFRNRRAIIANPNVAGEIVGWSIRVLDGRFSRYRRIRLQK
jgi:hypothetical protein